jgi:putative FmdB family regulatory protein
MPTYEYSCTSCGHRLEAHQSFADEPLTTCPECGGSLRKVFGSVGIVLKGPGFYRTDSRNGSAKPRTSKEAAGDKSAASNGDGSSSSNGSSGESAGSAAASSSGSSSSGSSSPDSAKSGSGSSGSGSGSGRGTPAKTAAS